MDFSFKKAGNGTHGWFFYSNRYQLGILQPHISQDLSEMKRLNDEKNLCNI